jgi:hypothetical protein
MTTPQPSTSGTGLRDALHGLRVTHGPLFVFTGVTAGLVLFFAAGIFLDQRVITGAPAWVKPTKFAVSIAVYCGTLLWILSLVRRDTPRRDRVVRWTGWVVATTFAIEMVLIVVQVVRGTTSHFNLGTAFDAAVFTTMGASIVILFVANLVVAGVVLRERLDDRVMASAIRLGLVVAAVGMSFGFLMTNPTAQQLAAMEVGGAGDVIGAHSVGVPDGGAGLPFVGWSTEGGDLRVGHFIGMHALQVLPLLALWLGRRRGSVARRLGTVRVAAASYLGLSLLVTWQALRAQPLLRPDPTTLAALAGLVAATALALAVVRSRTARDGVDGRGPTLAARVGAAS